MYNAIEIARYVINYSIDKEHPVSNLKLQKLLYYIQAAFLVFTTDPCFKDTIESWRHGPVVPNVYNEFKNNLNQKITEKIQEYSIIKLNDDFELEEVQYRFDDNIINKNDKQIINNIIESYFHYDPWGMVDKTHAEEPWIKARNGSGIIEHDFIKDYFSKNTGRIYGAAYERNFKEAN